MNIKKTKTALAEYLHSSRLVKWVLLVVVMAVFTVILYPGIIITAPSYQLGDVAKRDIKTPKDFLIEDRIATERNRQEAAQSVLTVYDHNTLLQNRINQNVRNAFAAVRNMMAESPSEAAAGPASDISLKNGDVPSEQVWAARESFEKELGISVSDGAYRVLMREGFSERIADRIVAILEKFLSTGIVTNKEVLLRESDQGIILRSVGTKAERIIRNPGMFYGLDQAKTTVRSAAQADLKDINYTLFNLIVDFAQRLLQPNITLNRNETEERKVAAAADVKPILYRIKAGEMLLREGERVTEVQLLKLKTLRQQNRLEKHYARTVGALMLILSLLLITYFLNTRKPERKVFQSNKDLLFVVVLLVFFFFVPKISQTLYEALIRSTPFAASEASIFYGIPLAAGAMTVCLFRGFSAAVPFSVVMAACTAVIFQSRFEIFLYFLLNGVMGAYWMQNCRERKVFAIAGLKLGLLNVLLAVATDVYLGELSGFKLAWDGLLGFLGGVGAGILTAGIVPLLEMLFAYSTDITLLELANLERPILRRLMMEAPGTYHHSIVVGSMVEAAASEIGANPLLAKVCGYYHDIGKIKKPLYYIENQSHCENRHDRLAPSMSSLILISHVKEGVEIAKNHKLGGEISDAIRQHHGTSIIKYFYEKAKKLKGEDAVKLENFRYPGPKPQTREIGLVMMADVAEAASRTLENPTPSRIKGLVGNLMEKISSDGQLDHCDLTLRDLHKIKASFIKILNAIHHHRVEYPDEGQSKRKQTKEKEKHGGSDHRQPKNPDNFSGEGSKNSPATVRRIGVS
ncbi:MAG: HD family phosphohydrolase [Thermodesulfobacteriota bacterium]